ncbi:unnamed protein product [Ectocarpus sp. 12 AP-2014]
MAPTRRSSEIKLSPDTQGGGAERSWKIPRLSDGPGAASEHNNGGCIDLTQDDVPETDVEDLTALTPAPIPQPPQRPHHTITITITITGGNSRDGRRG